MIDSALSSAFANLESRQRDVAHAYDPDFEPAHSDIVRPLHAVPSNDPLSVAIPDGAYVAQLGTDGKPTYSRDGAFRIVDGELRGAGDLPVLGFAPGDRSKLVPLRIDRVDAALERAVAPSVEADGSVGYVRSGIDPRTGERRAERITIGRIALARFPAGTQPVRLDAGHVAPPPGVRAMVGLPLDGTFPKLTIGARETGRVDLVAGLEKLRDAYRTFEAMRAANHVRGSVEKTMLDLVK